MRKWKVASRYCTWDWKWFFILPTILVDTYDQRYIYPKVHIAFHWLGMVVGIRFVKEIEEQ